MGAAWAELAEASPALAAAGLRLLRPTGDGVAFLATVRKDGGPRVHPVMPVATTSGLYVFVVNLSHKYRDLLRDQRYALHAAPTANGGEEFYLTGDAMPVDDRAIRAGVTDASGGRLGHNEFEALFELRVDRALHTAWANWGTAQAWPSYAKWAADPGGTSRLTIGGLS
jgi:hypothetical protein